MKVEITLPIFTSRSREELIADAQGIHRYAGRDPIDDNDLDGALHTLLEWDGKHARRGLRISLLEEGGYPLRLIADLEYEDMDDALASLADMDGDREEGPDYKGSTEADELAYHVARLLENGYEPLEWSILLTTLPHSAHERLERQAAFDKARLPA